MFRILKGIGILTILLLLGLAASFFWFKHYFTSAGPLQQDAIIHIKRGTSVQAIVTLLEENHIIQYSPALYAAIRATPSAGPLQAGEYRFSPGVSPKDVLQKIRDGDVVRYSFTLPEGLTSMQAAELLFSAKHLEGALDDIPAEGSLLPETYIYHRGTTRDAMVKRMQRSMQQALNEVWGERADHAAVTNKNDMLILASVIEKETGIGAERARVGGVFTNRLRKNMRLQSDPTVIYAVTKGQEVMDRPISKADLRRIDPYNTYTANGLPPGPICNPGRNALKAAANPDKTDELFFVADGKGGHVFNKHLRDHNYHVRELRKRERATPKKP